MSLSANSAAGSVSLHEEANLLIELEAPKTARRDQWALRLPVAKPNDVRGRSTPAWLSGSASGACKHRIISDWEYNPEIQVVCPRVQLDEIEGEERKIVTQ